MPAIVFRQSFTALAECSRYPKVKGEMIWTKHFASPSLSARSASSPFILSTENPPTARMVSAWMTKDETPHHRQASPDSK
jgi:hypothetical protein